MVRSTPAFLLAVATGLAACADAATRTTIVFRHTFRAPAASIKCTPGIVPAISDWDQFSAEPWPDFGTAPKNGTMRGLELTAQFAALLPEKLEALNPSTAVRLVYDEAADRDLETALALAVGFAQAGITDVTFEANTTLFSVSDVCGFMDPTDRQADLESQLTIVPRPDNYADVMAAMQEVLGHPTANNSAPPLNSSVLDDYFSGGFWEGRTCLAGTFAEVFLFEYGSRINVGWGKVDLDPGSTAPNALYRLLETHAYYRFVNMKGPGVSQHDRSNMVNAMLRVLDGGDGSKVQDADDDVLTIFVGHDADVDQVTTMVGTKFQLYPDNQNGVPPMSGIVLSVDSDSGDLSAQYIGAAWDPQNQTALNLTDVDVVPAYFVDSNEELYSPLDTAAGISTVKYATLRASVFDKLYEPCVQDMVARGDRPVEGWVVALCVVGAVLVAAGVIAIVWRVTTRKTGPAGDALMSSGKASTYAQ